MVQQNEAIEQALKPTLVVIAGSDIHATGRLADMVAMKLVKDKNQLVRKFRAAQEWHKCITNVTGMNAEEIMASMENLLHEKQELMIVYGDSKENAWNDAMEKIASIEELRTPSSSLIILGQENDAKDTSLFEAIGFVDEEVELPEQVSKTVDIIKEARFQSAEPILHNADGSGLKVLSV